MRETLHEDLGDCIRDLGVSREQLEAALRVLREQSAQEIASMETGLADEAARVVATWRALNS